MQYRSKTVKQLALLVSITVLGVTLLVILNTFFESLIQKLDKKTINLESKIEIGNFIITDLYKIRSDFYELATTATNSKGRKIIYDRMQKRIDQTKQTLNVLNNGGVMQREVRLNIPGHTTSTKRIKYEKEHQDDVSLEAIDLFPKLQEMEKMSYKLLSLLETRDKLRNSNQDKEYIAIVKKIKRFYKTTPAFFVRVIENSSRLLYEGELTLNELQQKINEEKRYYKKLELAIIIAIILLMLTLGYIIAKQINEDHLQLLELNQHIMEQERSTRGILDAQPNIVVVSNGEEMLEANSALVDFFDGYDSFDDFKKIHACICDYFEKIDHSNYLLDIDYPEGKWFEHILANPGLTHRVAMYKGDELHHFIITAKKKQITTESFIIIVSLNDVTAEYHINQELKHLNDSLEDIVQEKTKALQELNANLEDRIDEELLRSREKDKRIIEQSRFAALGEMIGNIAHQWRQPLSAISSTSSGMQLQIELDLAKKEDILKSYEDIMSYVSFLTQTIEDFRTFFKQGREMHQFNMLEVLKNTLSITAAAYKDNHIDVVYDLHDTNLLTQGFPTELAQVYLNILNNAKDALINKDQKPRLVYIKAYKEDGSNIIEFYDNAGGIPDDIINKIFDPYFTTKHKSQGTGIGLYMSKDIIEKHMKGSLNVRNKAFNIKGETYKGARFTIELEDVKPTS